MSFRLLKDKTEVVDNKIYYLESPLEAKLFIRFGDGYKLKYIKSENRFEVGRIYFSTISEFFSEINSLEYRWNYEIYELDSVDDILPLMVSLELIS